MKTFSLSLISNQPTSIKLKQDKYEYKCTLFNTGRNLVKISHVTFSALLVQTISGTSSILNLSSCSFGSFA